MVRKLLIVLAVLLVLPVTMKAQELRQSPMQFVAMFSGWTDNTFSSGVDAGFKAGFQTPLDHGRGLWVRTMYDKWRLHPVPEGENSTSQSISMTVLWDWYIGKKWDIYFEMGPDFYLDGPLTGTDWGGGIGASRRFWTGNQENVTVQPHFDIFTEVSFKDGSGQFSGDYLQLNLGVKFGTAAK